jgi:hypothetical protein
MGALLSAISGGLGLAGSVFGTISAAKKAREANKLLNQEQRENQDWYNKNYNQDYTQTASNQALITKTADMLRNRSLAEAGRQAVGGGTDENVAQEKEQDNNALGNAVQNVAAQADARKNQVEGEYLTQKQNLDNQKIAVDNNQAQNISSAAGSLVGTAGNIIQNQQNTNLASTAKNQVTKPTV